MEYFITVNQRNFDGEGFEVLQIHGATEEMLKLIVEKYGPGFTIKACQEPKQTIEVCKKEESTTKVCTPVVKRKKRVVIDIPKVKALRKAGWSYEKISEEFNCSTQTIINHLKEDYHD